MLSLRDVGRKTDWHASRLGRIEHKLDEIAASLAVVMRALAARVPTEEKPGMSEQSEALKAKVREKKTAWDGLVAARDALEAKLKEAHDATDMTATNAAIDEAIAMLDTLVDPATQKSAVLENTPAVAEQPGA